MAIAIAVVVGLAAAFFTLTSAVTGLVDAVNGTAFLITLVLFAASALLTPYNKSARWVVAIALSLPPVLMQMYVIRSPMWMLVLVCGPLAGAFLGAVIRR